MSIVITPSVFIMWYHDPHFWGLERLIKVGLFLLSSSVFVWFFFAIAYFVNKRKNKNGKEKNKHSAVAKRLSPFLGIVLFAFIVQGEENLVAKFGYIALALYVITYLFLHVYVDGISEKEKITHQYKNKILQIDLDDATLKRLHSSDGFNKIYLKAYLTMRRKFVCLPVLSVVSAITVFFLVRK